MPLARGKLPFVVLVLEEEEEGEDVEEEGEDLEEVGQHFQEPTSPSSILPHPCNIAQNLCSA